MNRRFSLAIIMSSPKVGGFLAYTVKQLSFKQVPLSLSMSLGWFARFRSRAGAFYDAARERDRRCAITERPALDAKYGVWGASRLCTYFLWRLKGTGRTTVAVVGSPFRRLLNPLTPCKMVCCLTILFMRFLICRSNWMYERLISTECHRLICYKIVTGFFASDAMDSALPASTSTSNSLRIRVDRSIRSWAGISGRREHEGSC